MQCGIEKLCRSFESENEKFSNARIISHSRLWASGEKSFSLVESFHSNSLRKLSYLEESSSRRTQEKLFPFEGAHAITISEWFPWAWSFAKAIYQLLNMKASHGCKKTVPSQAWGEIVKQSNLRSRTGWTIAERYWLHKAPFYYKIKQNRDSDCKHASSKYSWQFTTCGLITLDQPQQRFSARLPI